MILEDIDGNIYYTFIRKSGLFDHPRTARFDLEWTLRDVVFDKEEKFALNQLGNRLRIWL